MTDQDLEALARRIDALERIVKSMQNNVAPTIPIYDSSNWPQDAVEGQIVIAPVV